MLPRAKSKEARCTAVIPYARLKLARWCRVVLHINAGFWSDRVNGSAASRLRREQSPRQYCVLLVELVDMHDDSVHTEVAVMLKGGSAPPVSLLLSRARYSFVPNNILSAHRGMQSQYLDLQQQKTTRPIS